MGIELTAVAVVVKCCAAEIRRPFFPYFFKIFHFNFLTILARKSVALSFATQHAMSQNYTVRWELCVLTLGPLRLSTSGMWCKGKNI